ncbi:MAG: hypothetical protein EPN37_04555 [Chitinophagaceae bacterium]|nr:MAG: hypothetical protein EPN37_04555 [Chitinophagaceae bacterium]
MTTKALNGQWLGDIALEASGNMDSLFEIANDNGVGITDDLTIADFLISDFSADVQPDKQVLKFYLQNNILPATGFTQADIASQLGGIGYMGIQIDFKIS